MPFCGSRVDYKVCVPEQKSMPPDRNFPNGRWTNSTIRAKDDWLREMHTGNVHWRIDLETDKSLEEEKLNEWGEESKNGIIPRFFQSKDCKNAYKALVCWINFPRCDQFGNSLAVCRTGCENFFKTCLYEEDLWRCGRHDLTQMGDIYDGKTYEGRVADPVQVVDGEVTIGSPDIGRTKMDWKNPHEYRPFIWTINT
eukprot:FR740485.1.p1 GENE.FR740485.1~~FR740485.1.p1  ORF type:complete len:216 (+),score=11.38 FR740485.1:59-649(+)